MTTPFNYWETFYPIGDDDGAISVKNNVVSLCIWPNPYITDDDSGQMTTINIPLDEFLKLADELMAAVGYLKK